MLCTQHYEKLLLVPYSTKNVAASAGNTTFPTLDRDLTHHKIYLHLELGAFTMRGIIFFKVGETVTARYPPCAICFDCVVELVGRILLSNHPAYHQRPDCSS